MNCWSRRTFIRAGAIGLSFTFVATGHNVHAQAPAEPDDAIFTLERPLSFVDGRDKPVTTDDFDGQWLLVYFGYMHCADLCPWGLTVLGAALDLLGPAARLIQPVFVTVDPERDRGQPLVDFSASFHERLVGLGGTPTQIKSAADAMGVRFTRVEQDGGYSVDHSSSYSLIDPRRRRVVTFRKGEAHQVAAKVVAELAKAGVKFEGMTGIGALR